MTARALLIALIVALNTTSAWAKQVCTVNGATSWHPVIEFNEGVAQGVAVDILSEFQTQADVKFVFGQEQLWVRTEHHLKSGELDIIAGAYFNQKRGSLFAYSKPFHKESISLFVIPKNRFYFEHMRDLIGKVGMRPAGGSYGERFDRFAKQHLELQEIFDADTMIKMLINERADYLVLAKAHGLHLIETLGVHKEVIMHPAPVAENDVHFLFNKNSPCMALLDDLNRFIELQK